jgi:hypothetical protein
MDQFAKLAVDGFQIRAPASVLFRALSFMINIVEYNDASRLNRLRLEDSFLPGALQKPCLVAFHDTACSARIREMTPIPGHIINTSLNAVD